MSTAETQIGLEDTVYEAENPLKNDLVIKAGDPITDKLADQNNLTANP